MLSYNSLNTVYDIPSYNRHHDRSNTSVYTYYLRRHASLDRLRWRAPHHISTRQRVATIKQTNRKHRRDGRVTHSWRSQSWLGWRFVIRFDSHVSYRHSVKKREMTSSRARMSGTRRDIPVDCCRGVDGARPEWSEVEGVTHARQGCGRLGERR